MQHHDGDHGVERVVRKRQPGGVSDHEVGVLTIVGKHPGVGVDPDDLVSLFGEVAGQGAFAAADVQHERAVGDQLGDPRILLGVVVPAVGERMILRHGDTPRGGLGCRVHLSARNCGDREAA